ncbi:MAG: sigma-70 family RNA polymerase sigma factor [Planctomycetes bacterium]|nr:sigma-70 family RNA polymerase sigma factor [Planctomycetota bacterium]
MEPNPGDPFGELLRRARGGDERAWEEIFSRLGRDEAEGGRLLAIARRVLPEGDRLRDLVESRDLLQSALRSGWIDASQFRGSTEAELFAWLGKILRRKVGRVARRRDPRPAGELAEDEAAGAPRSGGGSGEGSPLEALLREDVRSRVRAALELLPEDQRAVMELHLQGLGAPEIARMLSLKPAAVRKRESRAAARLRELLEPD